MNVSPTLSELTAPTNIVLFTAPRDLDLKGFPMVFVNLGRFSNLEMAGSILLRWQLPCVSSCVVW